VLNRKQPQQRGIDCQGLQKGQVRSGVNRLRHAKVSEKTYRIQKSRKKYHITGKAIQERRGSA
jgi:hypothetical protein